MTTLHDRLDDLAADAPGPSSAYAGELWARGKRRQRRRRAGVAAVLATVVVAVALAGPGAWWRPVPEPVPAAGDAELRLPDTFHAPGPWLPGTADEGPIGPVAAVVTAHRQQMLGEGHTALAGVSAVTGEYRYLDVRGLWPDPEWFSLSPDGRHLAYWVAPEDAFDVDEPPLYAVDLAVYDTVTGQVHRQGLDSDHGFMPAEPIWVSADEVRHHRYALAQPPTREESTARDQGPVAWMQGDGSVVALPEGTSAQGPVEVGPAGELVRGDGSAVLVREPDGAKRRVRPDVPIEGLPVSLSPDGRRVAALEDNDADPACLCGPGDYPVVVFGVTARGATEARRVPGLRTAAVVGWRDLTHLVVVREAELGGEPAAEFAKVDIRTGETEALSTLAPGTAVGNLTVATSAWQAPLFEAPAPPTSLGPRVTLAVSVGALVLGLGALRLWRRRARP